MVKKRIFITSLLLTGICSCLVLGRIADPTFAQDSAENDSTTISLVEEYAVDLKNKNDFADGENISSSVWVDNLSKEPVDNYDYSKIKIIEHVRGEDDGIPAIGMDAKNDCLQEDRGNGVPSEYHDLTISTYHYDLDEVYNYVYTNYYFNASSTGSLKITFDNYDTNTITFRLYEVSSNIERTHWTGNPQTISGVTITNLPTNKLYYFKFEVTNGPVIGEGTIYHP